MSGSERAFDKVKSILTKLDRNIDAARERRLHGTRVPPPKPAPVPSPAATTPPGTIIGAAEGARSPGPASPGSIFGRATPIRSADR
ncbi:MAG: hypothetical protein AB7G11_06845 [Phycisphaerales bacterium]